MVLSAVVQFWISLIGVPYDHLFAIAEEAERLGFAGLALADHVAVPTLIESAYPGGVRPWSEIDDWPDVWVMIGAMAARTTRLRFVTNVFVAPMRHPLITAKAVGTASVISNGRVVFGAGIGWMVEEFDSLSSSFRTRGKRTDEILAILRDAWEQGRVSGDGKHYHFAEVNLRPQPTSPIPIWIGGHSDAALERAAVLGDGWISGRTLETAAPLIERLHERRAEVGKGGDPFDVAVSLYSSPNAAILGAHRRAGVEHIKVDPWDGGHRAPLEAKLEGMRRFADRHLLA
jgi:probable F420-dependent oxidoreductase